MMATSPDAFATRRAVRKEIAVWDLIVWAFRNEAAQLDFVRGGVDVAGGGFGYASMTAIISQHEQLGCRIDGGGRSEPHPDADLVAAALAVLPAGCGGEGMALSIVEHARAATLPEWDVKTWIEPVGWQSNQHGGSAKTADAMLHGPVGRPSQPQLMRRKRNGDVVKQEVRCCPVIVHGGPNDVARLRRWWLQFRLALFELQSTFRIGDDLTAWTVTNELPPLKPWERSNTRAKGQ